MGQPLIPTNHSAYQQQLTMAAMQQNNMLRAQGLGQLGGQLLLSPRLGTPVSQHQQHSAALMSMQAPPPMVSSTDGSNNPGAMLYSTGTSAAAHLPNFMHGQATDLSSFGLVNQPLFEYPQPVDQSAAGMSTKTVNCIRG